ncbi:hypothetical protein KC345_g11150, partial [Hortaea werneckii]
AFSIDEQFLDVTGSLSVFGGDLQDMIYSIQQHVLLSTGVWTRVGIGPTKILAKMANNFAKKKEGGVFRLDYDNIDTELWPLPVHEMFMVAGRMTKNFYRMGITTIGDIARMELGVQTENAHDYGQAERYPGGILLADGPRHRSQSGRYRDTSSDQVGRTREGAALEFVYPAAGD